MNVITFTCMDENYTMLVKGAPGDEVEIIQNNWVNTMCIDGLAPCVTKSPAAISSIDL